MKKMLGAQGAAIFLAGVVAGRLFAQQGEAKFETHLSAPGKLEIVRHPQPADYSQMHGGPKMAALPAYTEGSREPFQIDLRSRDLSALDVQGRLSDLLQADFDNKTVWPSKLPDGFEPQRFMEIGRNPGLGLRSLHKQGIDGTSVGIAIIDQALLVDHVEYKDRLRLYEEINWLRNSDAQMHGPAVASIAVGKNVGVAPGADLYFIAEWHSKATGGGGLDEYDLTSLAQSIDRIVAVNKTLPPNRKIRVISISLGINPKMGNYELVKQSMANAEREGIYTVHVGTESVMGLGRDPLADPDRFESYGPGQFWGKSFRMLMLNVNNLMVPMDSRCTAAPNGNSDYAFYRTGGMSWAAPWVAGMYALACQVKPAVTPKEFWEVARNTSAPAKTKMAGNDIEFGRIIDPQALIKALRGTGETSRQSNPV